MSKPGFIAMKTAVSVNKDKGVYMVISNFKNYLLGTYQGISGLYVRNTWVNLVNSYANQRHCFAIHTWNQCS